MAQGKKSFIIYTDSRGMVNKLSNERAGILFKTLFSYCDDENPICEDEVIDIVFEHFKNILKRDLKKYEKIVERNRNNGKSGGRPKNPMGNLDTEENPTEPKKADNDNDNDNVNDINNNISALPKFSFYHSLIDYGAKDNLASDWLQVRKNKKATNTQTAFTKFINQVEKSGHSINDVLEKCIEKSWSGFEAEWYKKQEKKNQPFIPLI